MAGLVPAISIGKGGASPTEMAGPSPAMTRRGAPLPQAGEGGVGLFHAAIGFSQLIIQGVPN